jgi:hypothetical protein
MLPSGSPPPIAPSGEFYTAKPDYVIDRASTTAESGTVGAEPTP